MKFAVTPSHQLSAEISYYTDQNTFVQTDEYARPSQFNLLGWPDELQGKDGFYVQEQSEADSSDNKYFSSTTSFKTLSIFREGVTVRSYSIITGQKSRVPPLPGKY